MLHVLIKALIYLSAMNFTKQLLITKLKATGVHLSLSLVVFVYLAYQIFFNWYPQPYFEIDGGWQGMRLVGAVDLILGPLITFLIFDLSKSRKAIIFDLMTIAAIQIGALAYGVYATYSQRPVAIVLIDEFVISAIMENYRDSLSSEDILKQYSDEKPPIIYSDFPLDRVGIDEVQRIKIEDKVLEIAQMHLYRPRTELLVALQNRQLAAEQLLDKDGLKQVFADWLQEKGKTKDEVLILRFSGRYDNAWLIFDLEGHLAGYF